MTVHNRFAPAARPHQPRAINIQVETLPGGRLRVSTPQARGWAAAASTPQELARAVQAAFAEVQVASYARAKNAGYDLDLLTEQVRGDPLAGERRAPSRSRARRRSYPVENWTKMEDQSGVWVSPSGRRYRPGTQVVRLVVAKREALGLPV